MPRTLTHSEIVTVTQEMLAEALADYLSNMSGITIEPSQIMTVNNYGPAPQYKVTNIDLLAVLVSNPEGQISRELTVPRSEG